VDRLSELLGRHVRFAYTALDRIVLNGYLDRLQRPEDLVHFFHRVAGVPCIDPGALAERTERYRAWVDRYAAERGIPVLRAPKGARKEDLVRPYYRRLSGAEGVACILSSMEQNRTFVSYAPRAGSAPRDPNYRLLRACRKRFLHYYFYVLDPVMGPMSLRVASYLPFNVTCYLNGHGFLARELAQAGIPFRLADNAILDAADPAALQAAADRLGPELLRRRCDHWTGQVAPHFSHRERAAFPLAYRYSLAQVELATDVVFARSAPLKALFGRAVELGLLLGGADRATHLFGRQVTRRYRGKLQTVLERRDEGHPVLRSYYRTSFVKQYEKADRLLRTETCINDPYHLSVGRRLENLPTLAARMAATNARYLDLQAELLASTVDAGDLARLSQPTRLGQRRIPGIKLHDDRVLRLLEAPLHPGGFVADWTTREAHARILARHRLSEADYRLGQLRYDLTKLRVKGLVERLGTTRRYRLTAHGLKLGVLLVKLRTRLLGPLCSLAAEPVAVRPTRSPSAVQAAFHQVDAALDHLCELLGLRAA
jgi:hypothetical protein